MPRIAVYAFLFSFVFCAPVFDVQAAPALDNTTDRPDPDIQEAENNKVAKDQESANGDTVQKKGQPEEDAEEDKQTEDKRQTEDKQTDSKESIDTQEKAEEAKEDPKKKSSAKTKPFKVERKPLKVEVKLDGIFVADQMEEVALRPEVWTKFKVLDAVEHGSYVKKGDVLVRFEPEDLEKKIASESIDQQLSELSLLKAEEEAPRVKKLLEMNFESARRSYEEFQQDYEYYHSTDRPFNIAIANYRYKSAQEELAEAREELNQLQKMYEADELTEETEEIVLRRQRFVVETAELVMELSTANRDYTLDVLVPRMDETYRVAKEKNELTFKKAKTTKETSLTRQVFEMEKLREARARSVEQHAKLISDKGLLVIRAPSDGVIYYGRCLDGTWSEVSSFLSKLKPLGAVSANSVIMTIVKQRPLKVLTSFGEKDLPDLKSHLETILVPTADEELEIPGKVAELESVPGKSNKFKLEIDIDNSNLPIWLVAGMTCKAKVTTYNNGKALQIPLDLVQSEEDNKKIKYVMLVDEEEDEPVKRKVKLGRKQDKMVEVLKGLEEGDEIVKEEKKDGSED